MKKSTICAQSTPHGKSGVAVFRISGSEALKVAQSICEIPLFKERYAHVTDITHPTTSKTIDQGVIIYFKGPKSFTGEDVIEIHTHGSIAVHKILIEALLDTGYVRIADPGEFTKRAFMNGKIDLVQAEGVADLLSAETKMQHSYAMDHYSGKLSKIYCEWRSTLLSALSYTEAIIDFADDGVSDGFIYRVEQEINTLIPILEKNLDQYANEDRIKNGIRLGIFGPPNVGKSSLMNFLSKKDTAIVSDIPGTTRDLIESYINIGDYPFVIVDTAGIRDDVVDIIESEGIKRSIRQSNYADIKVVMLDFDQTSISSTLLDMIDQNTIIAINKSDIKSNGTIFIQQFISNFDCIILSVKEHQGLDELKSKITLKASEITGVLSDHIPVISKARYMENIRSALRCLKNINYADVVDTAEKIRVSIEYMSFVIGHITVDEVLGQIFSTFCIGK